MRKISIIIPTKNNLKNLNRTIESITKSVKDTDYEIIIVDASEPAIELKNDKVRLLRFVSDSSIKAMVHGMKQAEGDIFLTHDDVTFDLKQPNWLKEMQESADQESVGLVTAKGGYGISGPSYVDKMVWVGTWCMYVPKTTIDLIGYLDDKMMIGEDIDYSYRVFKNGLTVAVGNIDYTHHQERETPHSEQSEKMKGEASLYFKKKHKLK